MEKELLNTFDKELLLKDLCARLPYGVRCKYYNVYENCYEEGTILGFERKEYIEIGGRCVNVEEVRPYLFPLSSMTEEQKKEISKRYNYHNPYQSYVVITNHSQGYWDDDTSCNLQDYLWMEDWFNKNHFDYRGLIDKGLAIDATGLNIY